MASLLKENDANKERGSDQKVELINEIRSQISDMMSEQSKGATVAATAAGAPVSIIGRVRLAVGSTAAAVDADTEVYKADNTNAEAAAEAVLLKFGSKFANVGSKSKNKLTTGLMPARALHWPVSSSNGELKVVPNNHFCTIICVIWDTTTNKEYDDDKKTSTHLDSHANMTVAGRHDTVINKSGNSADVRPFSKDCSKIIAVPIVDVAIAYDCPYSGITYILIIKNTLYIPSMNHNLVPPFIMREAGLIVNDIPRIHTRQEDLTNQTYCILSRVDGDDNGTNLNICMSWMEFSHIFLLASLPRVASRNVNTQKRYI